MNVPQLNQRYAIAGQLAFVTGPGGWPVASIDNEHAMAEVSVYGGQVLTFVPRGEEYPVLWLSGRAHYALGKAIRGGIPVCWPWFGDHPGDASKPAHGFARTQTWQVAATQALRDGATRIDLRLHDNDATGALWPHRFELETRITVGAVLQVELIAKNTDVKPVTCSAALHSYFDVSDIEAITILGLEGCDYLDKVRNYQRKTQENGITVGAESDRIYLDTASDCIIDDAERQRRIHIGKSGSGTTVVWNPWRDKAARMSDFAPQDYRNMVCVEAANAADDSVTLAPGAIHTLATHISVER